MHTGFRSCHVGALKHASFSSCGMQPQELWRMGLVSSSTAHGIFLDWGLNPCPLHLQVDSYPLYQQGNPILAIKYFKVYSPVILNAFTLLCIHHHHLPP